MTITSRVLLVEGNDDLHVCASLFKRNEIPETFTLHDVGGVDRLLEMLPVQLKASGIERVGMVVDADLDATARWNRIRSVLISAGFSNIATTPNANGTVLEHTDMPRVGIWLMPDNRLPGMVEDFAAYLIPQNDLLSARANRVINEIPTQERRFSIHHRAKAHIHTWLAWQADPGTPMGLAITKKYLDGTAASAGPFLNWIRKLFLD